MASEYTELVRDLNARGWGGSTLSVNIPGHTEERFSSPSGRYEVEISPVNGYDDGELHEERLKFFVNVYTYRLDDDGNRVEEDEHVFSRQRDSAEAAVELAEEKIAEYDSEPDA